MRCMKIIRALHGLLNFFLLLIGILLIVIAILVLYSPGTVTSIDLFDEVIAEDGTSPSISDDFNAIFNSTYLVLFAWTCVGVGVIIVIVSLCSCLGSCFLSLPLLSIYIFVLVVITLIQIGCGIIIVLSPAWFRTSLNESFADYLSGDVADTNAWASLQITFECCGVNGTEDFGTLLSGDNTASEFETAQPCCAVREDFKVIALTDYLNRGGSVLDSTPYVNTEQCRRQLREPDVNINETVWNNVGCVEQIYGDIALYGIIAICVVAIEILIIVLSCIICCHIEQNHERPI